MDPRMTTDSLEKINDVNAWGIDELVEHPFETVRSRTLEMRKPVALATVIVCTSMLIFLLRSVKDATYRLAALMTFLAAAVLLMYLFFKGRLPLRAFMSVMLPSSAVLGALVLMCAPKLRRKSFAENHMQRFWLMLHGMLSCYRQSPLSVSLATSARIIWSRRVVRQISMSFSRTLIKIQTRCLSTTTGQNLLHKQFGISIGPPMLRNGVDGRTSCPGSTTL